MLWSHGRPLKGQIEPSLQWWTWEDDSLALWHLFSAEEQSGQKEPKCQSREVAHTLLYRTQNLKPCLPHDPSGAEMPVDLNNNIILGLYILFLRA